MPQTWPRLEGGGAGYGGSRGEGGIRVEVGWARGLILGPRLGLGQVMGSGLGAHQTLLMWGHGLHIGSKTQVRSPVINRAQLISGPMKN